MQTHYGQYQQQYSQQRSLRKQSPALETPLPEFVPPQGQRGQDIMIIWDFQNVRTPTELEPVEIIRFMYDTFVKQPGPRRCAGAFCTFTDNTKKAVGEKRFNQFCSNGVLNFMMINSPGGPRKADDSDHPLKEMMMNFTVDCVRGSKDGVLLLITADADFVRPAIWCKQQGCVSLELIYYGPIASREIRELEANWKMEWRDFLDCMMGRRCAWTFPYPQDVAAGLVPTGSSGNSGGYNSSYNSNGGSSGYQQEGHRRLHPAAHRIQQQQHQLHLPGPPQRLALPPPPTAAGARQGYAAGTATIAAPAVTVSTTHVEQAAEQLLHNPAALQQVMQQYKQSMQTTAVLQQVLQGVAQKATTGATATAPVSNAVAAQAQAQAQAAFLRANIAQQQQQQQQQQSRAVPAAAGGPFVMQANKPVTILRREAAPGAGAAAAAGLAAGAGAGLTWQQREEAASSRLPADAGSGVNGPGASGGRSPPPPEWWDPSAAASARGRRNSKSSVGGGAVGGTGSFSRHGSSNGNWGAAAGANTEGNASSEGDDTGFWDSSAPGQGAESSSLGAANRSGSSGRLNLAGSSSGGRTQGQEAGSSGDGAVLSPPAGTGLPPPLPSMGLMKRAAGTVGAGGGGSKASGSGGNLAALLAAAAAGAGSPAKPSGRTGPGQQSPLHQHKHHGSLGSEQGLLSPADKHEVHHQQALAVAAGGAEGGFMHPQRPQQQQQVFSGLDQMRSPSPGLSSSRSDRDRPQQQQPTQVDRHMQHHEQQLLLATQRNNKQRPFHEPADAGASSASERPSAVPLNLFGGRASGSSCGDNSPQEHTGLWARPKGGAADPGMAAAARILSRATAQAAADASKAHGTGSHDGVSWASGGRVDAGSEGSGDGGGRRSSNSGGGVEIVEAPPLPPWMQQPQQQDDAGAFSGAVLYEEVVDEETGEVILVPKKQQRTPPAQQQQQERPGAYGSSEPVSIAAAAAVQAASDADAYASSEGIVTPSNTPCSGVGSLPMAAAAAGLARLSLGGGSNSSQGRSRLHGWQHPTAPADDDADAVRGAAAAAADAAEAAAGSASGLCGSVDAAQMPGEEEGLEEDAGSCAGDDCKLVSVTISTAGSLSSTAGCAEVNAGGDGEKLVQLLLEVCTAPSRSSSGAVGATAAAAAVAAGAGDGSSSSGQGADAGADVDDANAGELMAPLLGTFEGAEVMTADDDQGEFVTADCNVGAEVSTAIPALSSFMLGQSAAETLFPLSTGLEALVALTQGFASSAPHSAGFAGLGAGAPGMLPLPTALGANRALAVGSNSRGLDGLTLLGPVVDVAGAAAGVRGSSSSSPHHRPKQPSIAEQLQELQHILSADMAAEAANAALDEGECNGQDSNAGSTAAGEGDSALDEPVSAAAVSAEGSEGGTTEEGLGFEAVGLDGLPVYGPHLPPPNSNSEDDNADDAELLRLLGHAPVAHNHHHQQQQHHPQQGLDDAGDNDISVERMLQLLSMGTQPVPHSTPLVVSAPPMPLRNLSGSPVTAIEELGNVSSPSSAGSRTDGRKAAGAAAAVDSDGSA